MLRWKGNGNPACAEGRGWTVLKIKSVDQCPERKLLGMVDQTTPFMWELCMGGDGCFITALHGKKTKQRKALKLFISAVFVIARDIKQHMCPSNHGMSIHCRNQTSWKMSKDNVKWKSKACNSVSRVLPDGHIKCEGRNIHACVLPHTSIISGGSTRNW